VPEPEPRYILTFKPGTPEMVVVAVAALVGASIVVFFSFVITLTRVR
jgi:phosphatidylserine decarboxylase